VGPALTADPLTAVLDQLAACRAQLRQLDDREAAHFAAVGEQLTQLADLITTMSRTLADDTAALARLEALDRQVTELVNRLRPRQQDPARYAAAVNAGTIDDHIGRFRHLAESGVGEAMIRLPDLTDPAPLERAAKVISAFR